MNGVHNTVSASCNNSLVSSEITFCLVGNTDFKIWWKKDGGEVHLLVTLFNATCQLECTRKYHKDGVKLILGHPVGV